MPSSSPSVPLDMLGPVDGLFIAKLGLSALAGSLATYLAVKRPVSSAQTVHTQTEAAPQQEGSKQADEAYDVPVKKRKFKHAAPSAQTNLPNKVALMEKKYEQHMQTTAQRRAFHSGWLVGKLYGLFMSEQAYQTGFAHGKAQWMKLNARAQGGAPGLKSGLGLPAPPVSQAIQQVNSGHNLVGATKHKAEGSTKNDDISNEEIEDDLLNQQLNSLTFKGA